MKYRIKYRFDSGRSYVLYFNSEIAMLDWIKSLDFMNDKITLEITSFIFDS
jgi:hypothetical protein